MLAVACRRSWMTGTNEVLGCPQVKFFMSLQLHLHLHLGRPFKVISPNAFISKLLSGLSYSYPGCPGQFSSSFLSIYPYFLTFTYTFFRKQKTLSLDSPRLDARGRRIPLCTPLNVVKQFLSLKFYAGMKLYVNNILVGCL